MHSVLSAPLASPSGACLSRSEYVAALWPELARVSVKELLAARRAPVVGAEHVSVSDNGCPSRFTCVAARYDEATSKWISCWREESPDLESARGVDHHVTFHGFRGGLPFAQGTRASVLRKGKLTLGAV